MSKTFSNSVKKTTLWSVIVAIVLAAAIVVCALFGFNKSLAMKDSKTLTVSLNSYVYNTHLDEVKEYLEKELDASYILEGAMSGDVSEIVCVFDKDVDVAAYKTTVENYLAEQKANVEGWATAKYSVSVSAEKATAVMAKAYAIRAAIAGVVLAVLAFAYTALRYQLKGGLVVGVCALLAMLSTAALVALTRVYLVSSTAHAITFAGLFTAVATLFTMNAIRSSQKEEGQSDADFVASSIAVKEILYTAAVLAVGIILVGILGGETAIWFAAAAVFAILASIFFSMIFAPAMYVSVKAMEKPAHSSYVGAKKSEGKAKKAAKTVAVEETTVATEEVVEEATEEVVEETTEEVVEEATEEVVEETTEEVVEEATEEVVEETTEESTEE